MNTNNQTREERILGSLDGLTRASAPDFFYTRLTGRMQPAEAGTKRPVLILRPVFITGILTICLLINVFFLVQGKKPEVQPAAHITSEPAGIESFARAYNLETATVYE